MRRFFVFYFFVEKALIYGCILQKIFYYVIMKVHYFYPLFTQFGLREKNPPPILGEGFFCY